MLFRGNAGQRLEPVGIVGRALFNSPILHCLRHRVGHSDIQIHSLVNGLAKRRVNLRGELRPHHAVVENHASKIIRYCTHTSASFFENK